MCGDAYLLYDDDETSAVPHLHIVICEPDELGQVVLVSVTTRRAKSDTMVCLGVGDHPYLTQNSVITYAYSKILTVGKIAEMVASGDATPKAAAALTLVLRAQNGMMETDRAPEEVKELYEWQASQGKV